MSIASAITNAQGKVANAYTAVSNKGGTLPATQDLSNLPTAINSIPSGGGSDTIPSYQITSGALTRRTDTYNLTGTEFSGVTSILTYGLYNVFYSCTGLIGNIDLSSVTSIGSYGLGFAFRFCSNITGVIDLSSLTNLSSDGLYNTFNGCSKITGVDLSSLTVTGSSGLEGAFINCLNLISVDLSSLETISGYGLYNAFNGCSKLPSINLSSLISIGSNGMGRCFIGCKKINSIYFDSLTTTSFDNVNAFNNMFDATTGSEAAGGCKVHFPSNLQSTISGLTGYPRFGGNANYITLSFDLPATS